VDAAREGKGDPAWSNAVFAAPKSQKIRLKSRQNIRVLLTQEYIKSLRTKGLVLTAQGLLNICVSAVLFTVVLLKFGAKQTVNMFHGAEDVKEDSYFFSIIFLK